jgi:hypothetical protein
MWVLLTTEKLVSVIIFAALSTTIPTLVWLHGVYHVFSFGTEPDVSTVYIMQTLTWKQRVHSEITAFTLEHGTGPHDGKGGLNDIPLAAWETELPILDQCIRETLRLTAIGAFPRRNVGEDIVIDGRPVRKGDFALVMTEDVNLDPRLYPDPLAFQPDRDYSAAESAPFGFLGFGAGEYVSQTILRFSHLTYRCPHLSCTTHGKTLPQSHHGRDVVVLRLHPVGCLRMHSPWHP